MHRCSEAQDVNIYSPRYPTALIVIPRFDEAHSFSYFPAFVLLVSNRCHHDAPVPGAFAGCMAFQSIRHERLVGFIPLKFERLEARSVAVLPCTISVNCFLSHELDAAKKIVQDAITAASKLNKARLDNPRRNQYVLPSNPDLILKVLSASFTRRFALHVCADTGS